MRSSRGVPNSFGLAESGFPFTFCIASIVDTGSVYPTNNVVQGCRNVRGFRLDIRFYHQSEGAHLQLHPRIGICPFSTIEVHRL